MMSMCPRPRVSYHLLLNKCKHVDIRLFKYLAKLAAGSGHDCEFLLTSLRSSLPRAIDQLNLPNKYCSMAAVHWH